MNEFSEKTAERIDREVEKIMQQCYDKGNQLLTDNKEKLELLATTLLEKETLLAQEVYELLGIQPRETHTF